MFPCEGNSPPRGTVVPPHPAAVAPEPVTLNGNMFGEMLELGAEVAEEFGGGRAVCPGAFSPPDVAPVAVLHPHLFVGSLKPRLHQGLRLQAAAGFQVA